ncbi:MAG: phosphatase PAP2 family protein [Deltaproteobacteria bacterium]|nr:phosphatase PAP2 family protein [Deltaproteobacteria bacterium]MCB9787888.1 phosphatase PAP2 family protein [Deltaproteobacteria bacterium]
MPNLEQRRPFYLSEAVTIGYWLVVSLVILLFFQNLPEGRHVLAVHVGYLAFVSGVFFWIQRLPPQLQLNVRTAFAAVMVPVAFMQLAGVVPYLNPIEMEANLLRIDERIFGVNPQEWMQQYYHPALTEVLQVVYACFYLIPLAVGLPLLLRGRHKDAEVFWTAVAFAFYLSYITYIVVPARSPYIFAETPEGRYLLTYSSELRGLLLTDRLRASIHDMERIKHDCFPSGHTAVSLVVLLMAFRQQRKVFWVALPVVSALIFSTIYLRYHYVIDLVAGATLAVAIVWVTPPLVERWNRRYGLPDDPTTVPELEELPARVSQRLR